MGRARGQIGAPARSNTQGLFSPLLRHIANSLPPTVRKVDDRKQGRPAPKADLTDDQIAECRRANEAGEKKCKQLAMECGVNYGRMHQILSYQTRSARTDRRPLSHFEPAQSSAVGINPDSSVIHEPTVPFFDSVNETARDRRIVSR